MIRLLRLMEYTFETHEQMERATARFAVPLDGTKSFGRGTIRSATLKDFSFPDPEPTPTKEEWSVYARRVNNPEDALGYFSDHEPTKDEIKEWRDHQNLWPDDEWAISYRRVD